MSSITVVYNQFRSAEDLLETEIDQERKKEGYILPDRCLTLYSEDIELVVDVALKATSLNEARNHHKLRLALMVETGTARGRAGHVMAQ